MKKMTAYSLVVMLVLFFLTSGCTRKIEPVFDEITDARDGQIYKTVTLGDQTWLAQNLNYETDNSWCYGDEPANCKKYGRLYDWEAAMNACPDGWNLASDEEWSTLIKFLDPKADPSNVTESEIAGGMMKATGTVEEETGPWKSPNKGASNSSGFSAEAGGILYGDGTYQVLNMHAIYWTSTEYNANSVWFRILDYGVTDIYRDNSNITKNMGLSVRCIKD